jgi:hypothetical protein
MAEKQHIDYNEKKWADKAKIARENGSKSKGRPKKAKEPIPDEVDDGPYGSLMGNEYNYWEELR